MKKLTQLTLVLLVMVVAFAGCDAAKDAANNAASMADIDLGGLKMSELKEKFAGITEGFTSVTEESADGLKDKISDLDTTIDGIDTEKLAAPAKTALGSAMTTFAKTVEGAMAGVPEAIKEKLMPVVEPLMEKLKSFGS